MSGRECGNCGKQTEHFLCWHCTGRLKKELDSAAWLAGELQITVTRRDKMGGPYRDGGKATGSPLVFNWHASEIAWALHDTLSVWAKDLCDSRGIQYGGVDTTSGIARWLSRNVIAISLSETAQQMYDEITDVIADAYRAIDKPPGTVYIGPCGVMGAKGECGADLYAKLSKPDCICPLCGAVHDIEERRSRNRELVREHLYTANEIEAGAGDVLGVQIKATRIRVWASRGQVEVKGLHAHTHEHMFRLGDVLDRHARDVATRGARGA